MAKHVFLYSAARASPVTFAAHKSNAQSPTRDGYTFAATAKLMIDLRIAQRAHFRTLILKATQDGLSEPDPDLLDSDHQQT